MFPTIQTNTFPTPIPPLDFNGGRSNLVFLHGNGYPPACYRPLLSRLSITHHVHAMLQRPLWTGSHPNDLNDWIPLSEDLLHFLDQTAAHSPVDVIGHSMGGTTALRAALNQPVRFRRLILLDPVLLPPAIIAISNLAFVLKSTHMLHAHISRALNRRREFDNLDALFARYRKRDIFRFMDDDSLRAYIEGIVELDKNGGFRLLYSPDWEARLYYVSLKSDMDLWRALPQLQVPTLIIRGAQTDTFWPGTARKVQRRNPGIRLVSVEDATHLVPLEQPQKVADLILDFMEETK